MKKIIFLVLIFGSTFAKAQEADFTKYFQYFTKYFGEAEGQHNFIMPTYPDTIKLFWSDSMIEISSGMVDITTNVVVAFITPKNYGYVAISGRNVYIPTKYEDKQKAVLQILSEVWDFLYNLDSLEFYGKKIDSLALLVLKKYETISFKDCSSDPRCDLLAKMYESVLPEKLLKVKYGELSEDWEYTILFFENNFIWLYMESISDFLEIHLRKDIAEEIKFSAKGDVSYGYNGYYKYADKSVEIYKPEANTDDWGVLLQTTQVDLSELYKELNLFIHFKF